MEDTEIRKRKPDAPKQEDLNVHIPTYPYKSSSEYAQAVNQWLWHCYHFQCMTITLPYMMAQTACRIQNPVTPSDGTTDLNRNFPNTYFPNQNFNLAQVNRANANAQNRNAQSEGIIYKVPTIFKRIAAEGIDFIILLLLKLMITFMVVDFFDAINFTTLKTFKADRLDYRAAMELTTEILILEIVNRFLVCFYEAICTHNGSNVRGGATPGKKFMHLKVVSCERVTEIGPNLVRVHPASDLGFFWAFVRAFIKNFSYGFVLPVCCTMYLFNHNRTAYDHMCGSIVVEELTPEQN